MYKIQRYLPEKEQELKPEKRRLSEQDQEKII